MRIVLISEDSDFFEYILPKLILRKSDELFKFGFDDLPEKLHLLTTSLLIINAENTEEKTLELLKLVKNTPAIVFEYNDNPDFKEKVHKSGALSYITLMTPETEFQAQLIPALNVVSILEKNANYRDMLVKNNLVMKNNEVFSDYNFILDKELEIINNSSATAVLVAISPNDKSKFLIQPNQIETLILNNIRKNDILMNYATNKYFLLLYNADINTAQKIWTKIRKHIPEKIYAGFANTVGKKRQQLINEVLNRLHEAINYDKDYVDNNTNKNDIGNFKLYRKEFNKNFEKIVTPVFYQIQQKYSDKLFGMTIEQSSSEGFGEIIIKSRSASSSFKITTPGFSKINIDITYSTNIKAVEAKRITLDPEEFEAGLLEDLLEQFITEFKKEINNDNA